MLTVGIVYIGIGGMIRLMALALMKPPNRYFHMMSKLFLVTGFLEIVVTAAFGDRLQMIVGGGIVCVMMLGMLYLLSRAQKELGGDGR